MKSQIVIDSYVESVDPQNLGRHNSQNSVARLAKEGLYKDRSTICIVPTRGMIHAKVVQNWMGLMAPMNQKFIRLFMIGLEVGEAYEQAIDVILNAKDADGKPSLSTWKYVLTLEEDNMVPPDGLLKLFNAIDEGYDIVGGLYWTKGEGGQPMCYGNPHEFPVNFIPQVPAVDCVTPCNGLGMGFTLFKMEVFKDKSIERPFFKTFQGYDPCKGGSAFTQDLYFFHKICKLGYKVGCDSRVKVGHYDAASDICW